MERVGTVGALYRYPVKGMAGESLSAATLTRHGVQGDRRLAFVRENATGGFPWLNASRLAALALYRPVCAGSDLPTHVRTPDGRQLELGGDELRRELGLAYGSGVRLVRIDTGIFDDAPLSLISTAAVDAVCRGAERKSEVRRFRPNVLVLPTGPAATFPENAWVGKLLVVGEGEDAPIAAVSALDARCAAINQDPDTAVSDPRLLKVAARDGACAGVYASLFRGGTARVGDAVYVRDVPA